MRTISTVALLLALPFSAGAQRQISPKIRKGGRRICSMLVLPAQFTVLKVGFKGSQGLWEKNDEMEDEMTALVASLLSSHSATVSQTRPVSELDADQRRSLAAIQRKYDDLDAQMERSPGGVSKDRYSLGDFVAGYTPAATADTLVLIRGAGRVPAGLGGTLTSRFGLKARIGLVDARTGAVLALLFLECEGGHGRSASAAEGLASHFLNSLKENPSLYGFMADETSSACDR